jgi:hypothetical protein
MTARDYLVDRPEKKEEEESKHTRITIRMCMMDVQSVSQAKKAHAVPTDVPAHLLKQVLTIR